MSAFGIKRELEKIISRMGVAEEFEAFSVCRYGQKILSNFCKGENYKPKVIKYLKQTQTLEIELHSVLMGNKIRTESDLIIDKINTKAGRKCVEKIRYRLI
ncbi:MAG: hypothetical protein U9Q72_01745 [Patescibacteria group bacterium]|nr:hypothetical protein [Patescibacteria group bacterium]